MTGDSMVSPDHQCGQPQSTFSNIVPMLNAIELLPDLMANLQYWQHQAPWGPLVSEIAKRFEFLAPYRLASYSAARSEIERNKNQ